MRILQVLKLKARKLSTSQQCVSAHSGATLIAEFVRDLPGFPLHCVQDQLFIGQKLLQASDGGFQTASFLLKLASFQGSQPPQRHAQHCIGLQKGNASLAPVGPVAVC